MNGEVNGLNENALATPTIGSQTIATLNAPQTTAPWEKPAEAEDPFAAQAKKAEEARTAALLKAANDQQDREVLRFLLSPEAEDDDLAFKTLDAYSQNRWGVSATHGDMWTSDRQPFKDAKLYRDKMVGFLMRGYEGFASPEYNEWQRAKEKGDRAAMMKLAGVDAHNFDYSMGGYLAGGVAGGGTSKTDAEIDEELKDYDAKMSRQNFVGMFRVYDDAKHFTDEERDFIMSAVKGGEGLPADKAASFEKYCYENPDRAAFVCSLIDASRKKGARWWRDNVANPLVNGVVMFHDGLEAMESDTDEYARVLRDEMRRERQKDGKFYWNDAERGEYERLKADAERKWGEGTLNRTVALSIAEESVDAKCAMRRAEEALPRELRNERRRARILAREATRYRPTWEYDGFSKAVEGVFSTLPYMAVTAVPYLGFALNVAQQMGNTRDELIREGADPDESVGLQFVSALVWAATEKLQYEGLFNKSFTNIRRKQFFTDVMRTAWKDGKIKKIGNAVLHGSKEAALTTLFESLQEGAQGLVEGATNAYLLDTAKGVPLEKRIVDTISKGTEQGYEDFVGSLGTMGILGSIGAAHKFSRENRNAVDTNDLLEYAATQNRAMNVFKNATMQPDGEDADAGAMSEGVARMKGECLDIVRKHKEDGSGFLAAMDEIREKYELDENEARTVADYLDLRENLIDSARNADSDAQMEMIARMGGLYRVGDDTTLDPVDIFRVINPNIAVEEAELTLPYEMAEQGDRAAEPRPSDASGKVAAVQSEIDALEEQRKNAPNAKEKHRLHKAISKARERLREARREGAKEDRRQVSRKVLRVTIPVGDGGERRVVNIEYIRKAPNINTHAYATSVAEAMRGMVGADRGDGTTVADGRGMGVEEFKALPTDEKMAVAVTPEQYLAMTPEERQRYVEREYGIYESGHYQVYDENGKKVFSAEGAIRLSRAVMGGKWTGGNRTIVHEYGHAVVRLMRDLGLVTDEQTQTMRTLFGDPDAAVDELWNEEAMTEAFVECLRGKYDFRRLTPAERKAAQGWFANLWDTIKACVGIGTGEIPDAPVERTAREQAMDAAFEGLRNGDLKGLPALAGIEKDEKKPDAGENPSQKPADGEAKVEKENDTPDAPKPAEGKEITETAKPSEGQKNQPGTKPTLTKPTAPTPTAKTKAGKDVPDRDAEEAYKRGFADAMAQIASNPGGVAANVPQRTGTHFTVNTPDYEMSVEAEAMWVPLASLVESTDDQEVQMRDRSREATDVQIHNKTRKGKFKAIALFPGTRSDDGAPIVGGGCRIISGHGRKRMLETLLKEGRYGEYLDGINAECARRGMAPAPEGMENPVLVLRVTSGLETRDDLVKFADKSNKTGILEMSAAENAKNDIKAITPQLMSLYSPDASGNLLAASNRPFMAAFLKAIGSTGLTNADGTPTAEAALRAQRALMTAVFGKDDRVRALVQNLLERSSELSLGSLLNSLMKEAGRLISMKNKRGSFDIVNDVSVAAGLYVSYRAEASTQKYPVTFAEWLGTQSLFGDNATQMQKALALLLESGRFGSTLSKYSDLVAEQETDDQGLLGGIVEKRTPLQLLGYAERATLPLAEGLTEAKTDADYAEAPVTPHPDSEVAKSAVVAEPIVQEEDAKPEPAPAEPTKEETKPEKPAPAPDPVAVAEDMVLADARREPFVPKPVAKQTLAPAKLEERVTLTRPNGATKELPGGAWNHLRQGFEWGKVVPKSPQNARGRGLWATSYPWGAADRQSRDSLLKKWGGRCPKYMGNKNAMTTRTVMAVYDQMSPEERAHYEVVNDCFGGGGCWGLTLAMTCFPNARTLNVNEFEEGRLQKIRVLQTFDGRMKESLEAFLARTDLVEKARKVVLVSADGKEKKATWNGQDCRDRTFAAAKEFVGELTEDERGLLFALLDNMQSRMQFGAGDLVDGRYSFDEMVKTAVENLSAEAVKATEMADAFKSRGGSINYVAGDAKQTADFGRGFAVPHGDNVVSVCDPPYYRTTGYTDGGKSTVGLEKNPSGWGYEDTRDMLNALVDLGDALVYTDEAWWLNSNYEARTDEGDLVAGELFGGAFGPTSTYARENAVLQDIINSLDHFDVAGGVASRQEVLGIHHGHSNDHQSADGAVLRAPDDAAGGGLPADGGRVHGRDDEAVGAVDGGDAAQDGAAHGQDAQGDGRGRGGQESATAPARVDAGTAALAREVLTRALAEDIRRERPELTPAVAEAAARHSVRALYARERATPDAVDRDGDGAQRGERHSLPTLEDLENDGMIRHALSVMGGRAKDQARDLIARCRKDLVDYEIDESVDAISACFDTPKERKAALRWFCKKTVELPQDAQLVKDAVRIAEQKHEDVFQFERPGEIVAKYATEVKEKPVDPDTVPTLTDKKTFGHGVAVYAVDESRESQEAMRRIINTHWGKEANPWCLLRGDGNGNLAPDARDYWEEYSALPKRVAFKDGKLLAFMGTSDPNFEQWWDRTDTPSDAVTVEEKRGDGWVEFIEVGLEDGEAERVKKRVKTTRTPDTITIETIIPGGDDHGEIRSIDVEDAQSGVQTYYRREDDDGFFEYLKPLKIDDLHRAASFSLARGADPNAPTFEVKVGGDQVAIISVLADQSGALLQPTPLVESEQQFLGPGGISEDALKDAAHKMCEDAIALGREEAVSRMRDRLLALGFNPQGESADIRHVDRDGDGAQRGEQRHSLIIGRMGAARLGGDVDRDLAIAKRMLNAKETEEDGEKWNSLTRDEKLKIALATGWEVGADGDWRHEWRGVDRKAIRDGLYQSVLDLYKEYEDSPAEYIPTKLGKFLTKDALAAYPRLAEADVRFMRTDGKGYDGRANGETISIYPSALDSGADGFIEVLEHETQHLVQYIEGFARGSNAEYEESLYRKIDTGIPTSDEQYEAEHEAAVAMSELRGAVATFLTPYVERVLKEWHGVTTGGRYDYKGTDYADGGFNIGERDINDRDDVTWGIRDRIIEEIEDGEWGSIIAPDEYFDRNSVRTILERLGLYEVADIVELGDETSASGDEFVNEFNDGVGDALTKAVRSAKWRDQVNYDYRVLPALAGRENYNRVAGEVEARNASERDYDLSQGTGLMLADTEDVPRDQQIIRHSVHVGWRPDFPRAVCMTTRASLMAKHGDDFRKAKAGDREAAARLVEAVSKPDKIKALVAAHPNASIVCPVHAEEATGRNKIPVMFAQYIASVAGVECDDRIVQTVRANHTGSNAAHRLFVSPEFDGEVKKGAEYILVDDHITQGGTVNALRDHIESHGGKVVAVASLTLSQGSSILAPNKETIDAVRRKHEGIDQTLRDIGVADSLECLTQSECRYLASLSPDGLRDRIAASRPEGDGGLGEEAVREAVAPANERRLSPVNEAIRHSLFIGRPQTDYDGGARQATWEEAVFLFHDKFKGRNTDEARAYIYAKTGWWRGADRMWRVEIPNPTAKTRRAKKKIHPSMPANWGVVNGLYVNRDAAEYFCKLTDMVNLPEELVKAYPIIESIGIRIMDGDSDDMVGKAGYWNGTGTIALSWDNVKWFNDEPSSVPNDEGVKTITHELQHAIQDNAAFGSGASWTSHGKKNYVRSSGEVEARNAERRRTDVVNEDGDALIYSDLANGQGGEAVRKDAVRIGEAPWQTEDVPTEAQVLTRWDAKRGAFTVDQKGKVVPRQAVKVTRNYSLSTLAVGYLAQREMSGKPVSVEDADKVLKNLGVTKDIDAPTALAKAKKLATENKDALKAMAEKQRPELVEALAKAGMKQEMTETMDALIAGTAKKVDPEVGRRLQKAVTDRETRALMAAKGFTAAQLIAQCPIDLAKGLLAVAEYERTPEEKARLEEARKKREEERAKAMAEDDRTDEEMLADVDDPTVHDPTPDELALFNELMDAARFAEEARKGEEERKRRAIERRKAEEAKRKAEENGEDAGDDGAGDGDGDEPMEGLPADYVRRIAPIFEDADLFAQFVVQWVGRETMKKHPELPTTAEMWKSPVAIRELKQTATNILRRLAKDALGSPALNHARNFADHAINELESDAECKTFNNVRRQIAYIYDAIHNDALRMTRRQLVDRLVNGWKEKGETHPGIVQLAGAKGRFSATTEEFQRKIDGRTEMWARTVKRLVYMSEAKLEAYMEERERIVNANPTAEDLRDAPSADKVRQAADELVLARKYGGLVRQMPGAIADATDEIMTLLNGRLQEFEQRRLEREERNDKVKNAIIAAVMAGKAPAAQGEKSRAVKFVESFQGNVALEMQNLIRYCKDEGLRQAALEAIEELQIAITEGGTDYRNELCKCREEVNDGLTASYGDAVKGINHLKEPLPPEVAGAIFGQDRAMTPTYGHLLQLYASTIQQDYAENAKTYGRDKQLELMEQTLTDGDKAFHAWAVDWYKANRATLSTAVEAVTGVPVTSPDPLYCPVKVERQRDGFAAEVVAWSPIPRALSKRIPHGLDFKESANFLDVLLEEVEVRSQTIGYSALGIMLRDTLASREVQDAVRRNVGAADMAAVTDHLRDIVAGEAGKDKDRTLDLLNTARKWMARFAISGNLSSAMAQPASIPVWANVMLGGESLGFKRVFKYMVNVDKDAIRELIQSGGARARYDLGWSEEVQNVILNPSRNRILRAVEKVYDKGMLVSQLADRCSSLWIAQGFYRDAKARFLARGETEAEAKRKALALTWANVEATQQTGRTEYMNRAQRGSSKIAKALFQFRTAQLLSNNYLIQALREAKAGTPGAKGRLARALAVNAVVVPAYLTLAHALWAFLMGDEPPEDDESRWPTLAKEMLWSMCENTVAPLFVVNTLAEAGVKPLLGQQTYGTSSGIPAIDSTARLIQHGSKAVTDATKWATQNIGVFEWEKEVTTDKVMEDLTRLARDLLAPVRHGTKLYKNRIKEED